MSDELWRHGALELAGMIARKEVSSRDVVAAHLARIDEVNPYLNAVVRRWDEQALADADAADATLRSGDSVGPFHGVPITLKENIDLAGTPTTQSLLILADAVSPSDAPLVERVRSSGAIPIGRTNLPDLGLRVTTESSLHGVTHNPWDAALTAGGSSGGEGSALASGMSPLGFGNDIGGSLRNPAHCCGVTSIKPTVGVVPWATEIPPQDPGLSAQFMLTDGPMARRVADLRAALSVIAGAHDRDPRSLPVTLPVRRTSLPLRVAVCASPPGGSTHPEIAAVIGRAADALADAGAQVSDALPPSFARAAEIWSAIMVEEVRAQRALLDLVMGEGGKRFLSFSDEIFPRIDSSALMTMLTERNTVDREWHQFLTNYDVLLLPTWTQPPFKLGADLVSAAAATEVLETIRPVLPANLLGLPAAVVPVGFAEGMPVGAQLVGRRFADLTCLDVAEQLESMLGAITPIDPKH